MLGCADTYTCLIVEQGGTNILWEIANPKRVLWRRTRDDISLAQVDLLPETCCDWIGQVQTVKHELHLYRDGVLVWEGVINRLEYERNLVQVFASDMLWVASRRVMEEGYDYSHPNVASVGFATQQLLVDQCYAQNGDRWNMASRVHWIQGSDDPNTSSTRVPYSVTIWEAVDNFARYSGIDYGVVGRDIYHFDTHLAWRELPDLTTEHLGGWPRIVELGNDAATRAWVTNGRGTASVAVDDTGDLDYYGWIDNLTSNESEANVNDPPTQEELEGMLTQAERRLEYSTPPPVRLVLPENVTLLPSTPWEINDIIPGAWFTMHVPEGLCRAMSAEQKIDGLQVTFQVPDYEIIQLTAGQPPSKKVTP